MKKIISFYSVLLLISWSVSTQAQKTIFYSGIYKSAQDYKDQKLSFMVNCDSLSGKINLHHFFSGKYVDISQNGKKYRLSKDSIFGYRDCKQINYRFYDDDVCEYSIEEVGSIVIYSALIDDKPYTGKGIKLVKAYFFSKTLNSGIFPLTPKYLKETFREDTKLCNWIDSGVDITSYDELHKMYKLNYFLTQSNNTSH